MMSSLYISLPPYSDWMRIGSISNYSPSLMAMVKWKTLPGVGSPAQFGISAETANSTWMGPVSATSDSMFSLEERREFSKAIATDLLRYLSSFGHVGDQGVQMLDTWFTKFSRKMDMDPDYWKRVLLKD
ncbi:hypothetical protein FVE85_5323 [Porphyridium purpureum]|uniref:Hikeshi-like C-terminal domain-containing protein n=1 Tax=Porphyridium purpureum TaxID=35688 RepID=A0A5J4Z3B1_PORPP|nr:hypothetical protein FVE85_5323 [Porphyridium purpureum]|eukprot:POR9003..scf295_1